MIIVNLRGIVASPSPLVGRIRRWLTTIGAAALLAVPILLLTDATSGAQQPMAWIVAQATPVPLPSPIKTDDQKDVLDQAAAAAQLAAALAALLTLPFIAAQLLYGRHDARMQHTTALLARWEAREFRKVQSRVTAFLTVQDVSEVIDKLIAWEGATHSEANELPRGPGSPPTAPQPSQNDVDEIRNFFEDVAIRYNQNEIVREPVVSSIGYAAVTEFVKSIWLTHYERDGQSGATFPLYREWEVMVEDLRTGANLRPHVPWREPSNPTREAIEFLRTLDTQPRVGIICLPPDPSADGVALAKRVSRLFADARIVAKVLKSAPPGDPGGSTRGWRVFHTPSALGLDEVGLAHERNIARRLALWLGTMDLVALEAAVAELEQN